MRANLAAGLVAGLVLAGCATTTGTTTETSGSALAAALSTAYSTAPTRAAATTFEVQRELSHCDGSGVHWECTLTIDAAGTNDEPLWVSYFRVELGGDRCFTATETATRNANDKHRSAPYEPVVVNGCVR